MWLALAGGLFILAAWLMLSGQGEDEAPAPPKVDFPRRLRPQERERVERRRTYVLPQDAGVALAPGTQSEPRKPRDPLLAALPRGAGKTAVVIEANALRYSPIGELLLECLMNRGGEELERFKQTTGVDPLKDLDRLVITDEGLIVSGNFGDPRLKELLARDGSAAYGDGASLFELGRSRTLPDGGVAQRQGLSVGTWNDQMLMFGFKPNGMNGIKDIIDRVEGRGPDEPPVLSENSTYGEMYGVISVEQLRKLFPPEQKELADRLAAAAQNVELHVDASAGFAMTAQVKGADAALVTDLGKSLGGALSLARMKAQAEDDTELAQLLDFAKVRPDGNSFGLEMAVPLDVIQKQLAFCREAQEPPPTSASPEAVSGPSEVAH
ncbi:hypothetical protein D187_003059 [Cystobacter fuscus DSM 2262]|uniref:Uncharacterized protein n=2 Tax=Cystobacter fuscus TaxID=43 RepID=S9P400_CYSF2|nr:hypothetical protein D187_003059 [Cystobacter fuscus DSM 2262]